MTDTLLSTFGNKIQRLTLQPSSGGRYEVTIDGELVYSKKATGKHPPVELIVDEVRRRLPAEPA
jgi:selenoprotein W-related protein